MSFIKSSITILACAATITIAGAPQIQVGSNFPDLKQFKLDGPLPDTLAGKVVIVDFWASWCAPCKASFPVLNDLCAQYADKGVVIIGVNVDDKVEQMNDFLKKFPAKFVVVHDADKKLVSAVNVETMPTSFVINTSGTVRAIHNGFHGEKTKREYVTEIEELLKAK